MKFSYSFFTLLAVLIGIAGSASFLNGLRSLNVTIQAQDILVENFNFNKPALANVSSIPTKRTYYILDGAPPPPEIDARAYLLADLLTGDVLFQNNADTLYPIASVSKLVTAMTALDMRLPVSELFYPLLLTSSNQKAEEIAESSGCKNFIKSMNGFVARLGMIDTHFADPSGISAKNVSSANDLLILSQHLYKKYPDLLSVTVLASKNGWLSNNLFVQKHEPDYLGGKSGYTPEAKGTLVAIFGLPMPWGETRPIAIILLGTPSELGVKYELAQSL